MPPFNSRKMLTDGVEFINDAPSSKHRFGFIAWGDALDHPNNKIEIGLIGCPAFAHHIDELFYETFSEVPVGRAKRLHEQ